MKQFTDLLEDWLYAREVLKNARENYDGYSFGYFHNGDIQLESDARNALNIAFQKIKEGSIKCIVKDCINQTHEGQFVGELCAPCHKFVTTGNGVHSQAYRNAQRTWVGLTNEEFKDAINDKLTPECIAIAIEAKLKEKNGYA
jgi:hypothetical protein